MILTLGSPYSYAESLGDDSDETNMQYLELLHSYSIIESLFPDVSVDALPSYEEFILNKHYCDSNINLNTKISEEYTALDRDNCEHKLIIYENGDIVLTGVEKSIFDNSEIQHHSGDTYSIYWIYYSGNFYNAVHSVRAYLRRYYDSSTAVYYFDTPSAGSDTVLVNTTLYNLYRWGAMNYITFQGNLIEYNPDLGTYLNMFGLELTATLNIFNGVISASHIYTSEY